MIRRAGSILALPGINKSVCGKERAPGLILTITLMIVLTVAAAARLLAPHLAEGRVVFGAEPDGPAAFGSNMAWLAIRTHDTAGVVAALDLAGAEPCNWNSGIGTVYDSELGETRVFVTPPVGPWTFVVGMPLPHPLGRSFADKMTPMLADLSAHYRDVQYYVSYPPLDYFAWARVHDRRLVRAFAIGDEGIVWSKGRTSREEKALGLKLFELRGVKNRRGDAGGEIILHPTEEHVHRLAGRWSADPMTLDAMSAEPALGYIAIAPAFWRAERLRKTA